MKLFLKNILLIPCVGFFLPGKMFAQFAADSSIIQPQSLLQNPAQPLPYKSYFTMFPFSGVMTNISSSSVAYGDIIHVNEDKSISLTTDKFLGQLQDDNLIMIHNRLPLLEFGVRVRKNGFIHFAAADVLDVRYRFADDIFRFLAKGNGAYLGEPLQLGD